MECKIQHLAYVVVVRYFDQLEAEYENKSRCTNEIHAHVQRDQVQTKMVRVKGR